ncbi:hypothetical protein P154DRAFT_518274 [Amniculicola lignicola CBS 123094]|uniref:CENP-V/GFA domain-containing protein n=1 Tax=Amniculicola lignicola CBS 123094 TaxID=1392246 RepID=A0A6A5WYL2_9PLEO|nr:hypothetical protein P154DRAFT_518274 [Amniculicola lignicola CBS 123094]
MPKPGAPFPAVTGACRCGGLRYRMESAPIYNYACHCPDCQKLSGSVFAAFSIIEAEKLSSIGSLAPKMSLNVRPPGITKQIAACPKCEIPVWVTEDDCPAILHIRIGTLDVPNLMEPDIHIFTESKIDWIKLSDNAKTLKGDFVKEEVWPKNSLFRYKTAIAKFQQALASKKLQDESTESSEMDKTPTAQSPEEKEDDEAFEKRYLDVEKSLQERLEKLSLKLGEDGKIEAKDENAEGETVKVVGV